MCFRVHMHAYTYVCGYIYMCIFFAVSVTCTLQVLWALVHGQVCMLHRCVLHQRTHLRHTRCRLCTYVYMYICVYMHMHVCIYVCICMHMHIDAYVRLWYCLTRWGVVTKISICAYIVSLSISASAFGRCHACACVFVCICMHMHMCVGIYICAFVLQWVLHIGKLHVKSYDA